jgi:hypothetical protein
MEPEMNRPSSLASNNIISEMKEFICSDGGHHLHHHHYYLIIQIGCIISVRYKEIVIKATTYKMHKVNLR